MDKIYSRYIYLPAYLNLMNFDITGRLNVCDNNLTDYYTFYLSLVLDSKVSLEYEVEVDKLFPVLYEST